LTDIPPEKNIILKAVSLFRNRTGFDRGLIVKAEKRIPAGSGLGGGSSDAALTLLTLNKMAGFSLNLGGLLEMAEVLGSDVPFFIHGTGAALVTGRGECIKPLEYPQWFLVLINPGFPSGTADAFRLLDNYRQASFASLRETKPNIEHNSVSSWLCKMDFTNIYNDFLPVFPEHEKSVYNGIITQLKELGADFSSLSGSGSTCFGIFNEKTQADHAALVMGKKWKFAKSCKVG
jgi:4-diphosphocytidyl-2-C-methyl-D-erythritol kinase